MRIGDKTWLYGRWYRNGANAGLCMMAASTNGTYSRETHPVSFWYTREHDEGQLFWDSEAGGLTDHLTSRCEVILRG